MRTKLLTPERLEIWEQENLAVSSAEAACTIRVACERLAAVEKCLLCKGIGRISGGTFELPAVCNLCDGTGKRHEDWQAALRALEVVK